MPMNHALLAPTHTWPLKSVSYKKSHIYSIFNQSAQTGKTNL